MLPVFIVRRHPWIGSSEQPVCQQAPVAADGLFMTYSLPRAPEDWGV